MMRNDTVVAAPAPLPDTAAPVAKAVDSLIMSRGILSLEVKAKKDSVWIRCSQTGYLEELDTG